MTDTQSAPAALPSVVLQLASLFTRHWLTMISGVLLEHGFSQTETAQFQTYGLAAVLGLAGLGWSVLQKRLERARLAQAINAPPPAVPVKP